MLDNVDVDNVDVGIYFMNLILIHIQVLLICFSYMILYYEECGCRLKLVTHSFLSQFGLSV